MSIPDNNHVVFVLALGKKGNINELDADLKIRESKDRVRDHNRNNFNFSNWDFN